MGQDQESNGDLRQHISKYIVNITDERRKNSVSTEQRRKPAIRLELSLLKK